MVEPNDEENPSDEQLIAAGFDLADDLDRPDRHCDCPKCKAFYAAIPPEGGEKLGVDVPRGGEQG